MLVSFAIGKYKDEILCDVVPMHPGHLLLDDGFKNRYSFVMEESLITVPLSPRQVDEDQMRVEKENGKKEESEKEEKSEKRKESEGLGEVERSRKKEIQKEKEEREEKGKSEFFVKNRVMRMLFFVPISIKRLVLRLMTLTFFFQVLLFLCHRNLKISFLRMYLVGYHPLNHKFYFIPNSPKDQIDYRSWITCVVCNAIYNIMAKI